MIEVKSLCKNYGDKQVLKDLSFKVEPGEITGFVGPNGAGKSTTMKIIMGLEMPTSGETFIDGVPFAKSKVPSSTIGCCLGSEFLPEKMKGKDYLSYLCDAANIKNFNIEEALSYVGLTGAGNMRISDYSLGMKQRLGIAGALLGNPDNLMFDEPINGLDVDAIRWIREVFISLAKAGKTVFVSSHIMSELELIADKVIILQNGTVATQGTLADLEKNQGKEERVVIKSEQTKEVLSLFEEKGINFKKNGDEVIVKDIKASDVGKLIFSNGLTLYHLENKTLNLEDVFMESKEVKND